MYAFLQNNFCAKLGSLQSAVRSKTKKANKEEFFNF